MIEVSSSTFSTIITPTPTPIPIPTTTTTTTTTSTSTSTSTSETVSTEQKLTKKQKKALAFRDKTKKSNTTKDQSFQSQIEEKGEEVVEEKEKENGSKKFNSMEDNDVIIMEKSNSSRNESFKVEIGNLDGKRKKSSKGRSKETSESKEGFVIRKKEGENKKNKQRFGNEEEDGNESRVVQMDMDKKSGKKRKREELDEEVDEEITKETTISKGKGKGKGKGKEQGDIERSAKRRKGKAEGEGEEVESGLDKGENAEEGEGESKKEIKGRENQKLILFVGNLKYTTSLEAIKAHFAECTPTPQVRLLTPKPSANGRPVIKSKGCAFLEFSSRTGIQQALKLHQSMLDGRMINVELTAGGGGKSDKRMAKVRERNKELLGQRTRKAEKEEKSSKDGTLPSRPDRPQRYSSTSGINQSAAPSARKTWTVGDVVDDEVHRGGKKHQKEKSRGARKSRGKDWSSGVNAIPVG